MIDLENKKPINNNPMNDSPVDRSSNLKQKKKPLFKLVIGGILLLLLVIGSGAALYLTQMNQDVRQQASTGTGYIAPSPTTTSNPSPTPGSGGGGGTEPTSKPTTNPITNPTSNPSPSPQVSCQNDADCSSDEFCYQPPMPECPEGMVCAQVMPAKICQPILGEGPPSPSPINYFCNSDCDNDRQCKTAGNGLICSSGKCRLESNPTDVDCRPAVGPMCLDIDLLDAQSSQILTEDPEFGDTIKFTCAEVANIDHYIFRVIEPDGTITNLEATGRTSEVFTITQGGRHHAQCQICTTEDDLSCLVYEAL